MDTGDVSVAIFGCVHGGQWLILAFTSCFGAPLLHREFESLEAARAYADDWASGSLPQHDCHQSRCDLWQIERAVRDERDEDRYRLTD